MFFYLSKFLFLLVQPSMVCLAMVAAGLLFGRKKLAGSGFVALLVIGFSPLSYMMLLALEDRFPRPRLDQVTDASGIIILGGFEDTYTTEARGILTTNDSAERLTEGVLLAHRLPRALRSTSGRVAPLLGDTATRAPVRRSPGTPRNRDRND